MRWRGFTIVELLIVIVVVAILAAITIVAFRGVQESAYLSRAKTETSSIAKAAQLFYTSNERWPADVERNVPAEVAIYMNGSIEDWPNGPWPGSVYDYDYFIGSDSQPVAQISIRFCPVGGPLSACRFPNESWASGFQVNSSAYWCITGNCRAHPTENDDYPGYCLNCRVD